MAASEFLLPSLLRLCFLALSIFRSIALPLLITITPSSILISDRDLDSSCVFSRESLDFSARLGFFATARSMEERLAVRSRDRLGFPVELAVVLNLEVGEGCELRLTRGTDCACTIIADKFGTSVRRKSLTGVLGQLYILFRNFPRTGVFVKADCTWSKLSSLPGLLGGEYTNFVPHLAGLEEVRQGKLLHFSWEFNLSALGRSSFKSHSLTIPRGKKLRCRP